MKQSENVKIKSLQFKDDGSIPNNPTYPLLLYKDVITSEGEAKSALTENNWLGAWRGSVAPFHHYHSNTHEVLTVVDGKAQLQLGGEQGDQVQVEQGDTVVLPAGVGHKLLEASSDFAVIGAYPNGKSYDFCYGKAEERPENLENIKNVPLPDTDPLFGEDGPLFSYWADGRS
ncbi:cupin domain-containing protein [Oceanobacillus jeddahense]|uniref:Cupin domain-containing protein n=1 Tax=Oceanobacillus jeddahense TaxID=1462527 RepID=A0ABY5JVG3_9BACI|nr:cupin domain-containing protein [Oceanobacillus jeddahense]UUI04367.1 cupin domain-containing protein [Oceanobacillus jeddahense]